jgi:drug/metabolite transporter (DMT)-like permease
MNEMSVEHMVLYRFLFACLGMLPVVLMNRVSFTRAEVRLLLISAFFGVPVQFLMQFHGLDRTTVTRIADGRLHARPPRRRRSHLRRRTT